MNFLQLCQAARRECIGNTFVGAATPTTVAGQTGVLEKIVNNTAQAWLTLQALENEWNFLRAVKVQALTINTRNYNITSAVAPGLGITTWKRFDPKGCFIELTSADKTRLTYEAWEVFRNRIISTTPARPSVFTVNLAGEIEFDTIPDQSYTIRMGHWLQAVLLAVDGDTPVIEPDLHEVIVWESVMRYAGNDTASELYQHAIMMRDRLLRRMEVIYLPLPPYARACPMPGIRGR